MSIVSKRSPISATAELLFFSPVVDLALTESLLYPDFRKSAFSNEYETKTSYKYHSITCSSRY